MLCPGGCWSEGASSKMPRGHGTTTGAKPGPSTQGFECDGKVYGRVHHALGPGRPPLGARLPLRDARERRASAPGGLWVCSQRIHRVGHALGMPTPPSPTPPPVAHNPGVLVGLVTLISSGPYVVRWNGGTMPETSARERACLARVRPRPVIDSVLSHSPGPVFHLVPIPTPRATFEFCYRAGFIREGTAPASSPGVWGGAPWALRRSATRGNAITLAARWGQGAGTRYTVDLREGACPLRVD